VSFHVGSQQRNPHAWDRALASAAAVFRECGERGLTLTMVNLGGGFPTKYLKNVPTVKTYGSAIFRALRRHFGNRIPETIIEPGRGMVGNAGVIEAEVVLISKKSENDDVRWVYLDIGKFGGSPRPWTSRSAIRSAPRGTATSSRPACSPGRPAIPPT
jgi:ornithine decarboxylase